MTDVTLHELLRRLRDGGPASPEDRRAARLAMAAHPIAGELQVEALFVDEVSEDAAALLVLLEEAPGQGVLHAALSADEAHGDVVDGVMAALFGAAMPRDVAEAIGFEAGEAPELAARHDPAALPVAAAVEAEAGQAPELAMAFDGSAVAVVDALRHEAGTVAVSDAVMRLLGLTPAVAPEPETLPEDALLSALLDHELSASRRAEALDQVARSPQARLTLSAFADVGRLVREGVGAEAGEAPAMWRQVAPAVGVSDPEAVPGWDETVLRDAVSAEAGEVDVSRAVMAVIGRDARVPLVTDLPEPANRAWFPSVLLAGAAAVTLAFVGARVLSDSASGPAPFVEQPVQFASMGEIRLDHARYGADASVFFEAPQGDGDLPIVWVDDRGTL